MPSRTEQLETALRNLVEHARLAFPRTPYAAALREAKTLLLQEVPNDTEIPDPPDSPPQYGSDEHFAWQDGWTSGYRAALAKERQHG